MAVVEHGRFAGDRFVTVVELEVTRPEVGMGLVGIGGYIRRRRQA